MRLTGLDHVPASMRPGYDPASNGSGIVHPGLGAFHKAHQAGIAGGYGMRAKAEVYRWSAFLTSDVHASCWPIFMPFRYTTDTSDVAGQAVVEAGHKLVAKQLPFWTAIPTAGTTSLTAVVR